MFIDKARAIRDTKAMLEQEDGVELSLRQLTEKLRHRGYRVSPPILSYCDYAVDILSAAIPKALNAGLGKPAIQRLRELDRAATAVWEHRRLGPEDLYRSIFTEAIASADRAQWDFEEARRSLAHCLATRAGAEMRNILLEIGAELADVSPTDDDDPAPTNVAESPSDEPFQREPSRVEIEFDTTAGFEPPAEASAAPVPARGAPSRATPGRLNTAASPVPAPSPRPPSPIPRPSPAPPETGNSAPPVSASPQPGRAALETERLRQALAERARDYAAHCELGYCLRFEGSPWIRLGYIVADFPAQAQLEVLSKDFVAREALAWKWYELTRCCDLLPIAGHIEDLYRQDAAAKARVFAELFASGPRYIDAWASPETFLGALSEAVGVMDLQQFSFYAEHVDEDTWQAGMRMLQAYRELKAYAASQRIDLIQDGLRADASATPVLNEGLS